MVEELAELGASVYTCSRNEQQLNQRLQEWKVKGFNVSGSVCDASSGVHREQLFREVSACFGGKLHILVCSFCYFMYDRILVCSFFNGSLLFSIR